jgi:phosphate transport system protein
MARETLDLKIQHLLDEVLFLDSLVEDAIINAVEALKRRDIEAARLVHDGDTKVNAKRFELENEVIRTIATQQPIMAGDLRLLASILEVVGELERMGDYAKGIAHICIMMGDEPLIKPLIDIPRMTDIAVNMLHRAVEAFVAQDASQAREIPKEDEMVDALYNQIYHELVAIMLMKPATIDQANYLMWTAHNLERVADRVTNICERTIYVVTGELKEIKGSDDETHQKMNSNA